jgi:hypothetical protein
MELRLRLEGQEVNARPHRAIPGMGDDYQWFGPSRLMVNDQPVAESIEPAPEKPAVKVHGSGPATQDPDLERERALIGALILGWRSHGAIDGEVRNFFHRTVVDALGQVVDLGAGPGRLANAVEWCRAMKVDPILCGRVEGADRTIVVGFLAGCVRSARDARLEPSGEEVTTAPVAPVETIAEHAEEEAENWER